MLYMELFKKNYKIVVSMFIVVWLTVLSLFIFLYCSKNKVSDSIMHIDYYTVDEFDRLLDKIDVSNINNLNFTIRGYMIEYEGEKYLTNTLFIGDNPNIPVNGIKYIKVVSDNLILSENKLDNYVECYGNFVDNVFTVSKFDRIGIKNTTFTISTIEYIDFNVNKYYTKLNNIIDMMTRENYITKYNSDMLIEISNFVDNLSSKNVSNIKEIIKSIRITYIQDKPISTETALKIKELLLSEMIDWGNI